MPVSYDREHIKQWLDGQTLTKARGYQHAVSDLAWTNAITLSGKVQGTRIQPYDVRVYFHDVEDDMWIACHCSCPVGINCKHVAALLIAGLEQVEAPPANGVRRELVNWLEAFRIRRMAASAQKHKATALKVSHALAYVINTADAGEAEVVLYKARLDADGRLRSLDGAWQNIEQALVTPPKFIGDDDLPILRGLWLGRTRNYGASFRPQGATGAAVMEQMLATGRLFSMPDDSALDAERLNALRLGATRQGCIAWRAQTNARLHPVLETDPASTLLLTGTRPCWYLDARTGEAGPVDMPWPPDQVNDLLSMPAITPEEAALVGDVMRELVPDMPPPPGSEQSPIQVIDTDPVPVISLATLPTYGAGWNSSLPYHELHFATVRFDYAGHEVAGHTNAAIVRLNDGAIVQVRRRVEVERQYLAALYQAGLRTQLASRLRGPRPFPDGMLIFPHADSWPVFVQRVLPDLRSQGWRVEMSNAFSFNIIDIDEIDGDLRSDKDGWFDVEMGVTVNDRKVRLEPLLANLFRRDPRWLGSGLDAIADDEAVELITDREERLHLRAGRLKPVVRVLVDLFDHAMPVSMKIQALDAARIQALEQTGRWEFHGDDALRRLVKQLADGPGITSVDVPRTLQATLRPYQHQGLSWMQYLRENKLSGVLADDMGLGKTIQTLAHILAEKEAGRLDRPALVILPTSLVHNWKEEAQRFAPALRVLDLHGAQRHERFAQIAECDLVLTTYPLLWRDGPLLAAHEYHLLILDEAQYVKNAATRAAAMVRQLRARHRLCLTGTPLENHLGELWAQFDFLLPGFLGTRQSFTRQWRTPIEKGDTVRRDLLVRRIRPFMLRRRKDEVATELPPKTTIVRTVELAGAQRDLYETVRAAMQEKIQAAISANGLARSHIVLLDALLKLRQVCCDPRLVSIGQAASVQESAKLSLLMDMVPELIEEGSRILLFSQFTGMLDLIAAALGHAGIPFVMLTGDTSDRVTPVKRFMQGEVPLFLISLKAGGVGLNLTAADTVIHYDPWWNPAAENQATDRAHRIGQDKPVFVYKLIVSGSVEEKIVEMQEQKGALADAILSGSSAGASGFSQEDLEALFTPIPDTAPRRKNAPAVSRGRTASAGAMEGKHRTGNS
jgi:superfamily II DNA or RNA helicase